MTQPDTGSQHFEPLVVSATAEEADTDTEPVTIEQAISYLSGLKGSIWWENHTEAHKLYTEFIAPIYRQEEDESNYRAIREVNVVIEIALENLADESRYFDHDDPLNIRPELGQTFNRIQNLRSHGCALFEQLLSDRPDQKDVLMAKLEQSVLSVRRVMKDVLTQYMTDFRMNVKEDMITTVTGRILREYLTPSIESIQYKVEFQEEFRDVATEHYLAHYYQLLEESAQWDFSEKASFGLDIVGFLNFREIAPFDFLEKMPSYKVFLQKSEAKILAELRSILSTVREYLNPPGPLGSRPQPAIFEKIFEYLDGTNPTMQYLRESDLFPGIFENFTIRLQEAMDVFESQQVSAFSEFVKTKVRSHIERAFLKTEKLDELTTDFITANHPYYVKVNRETNSNHFDRFRRLLISGCSRSGVFGTVRTVLSPLRNSGSESPRSSKV